ncbi:Crp/Fnr family transcriptional regulator [Pedobacter frigoris]|uniref:Crp/Fnr family transcriptional regulator n=2 Tax=Pedobacter frigoris TaxID=2571272 RepID=A0A4U1CMY3_9SPHI|nr:Crp/Fnr family transcriptional regulator [Pedobacter frigoris]
MNEQLKSYLSKMNFLSEDEINYSIGFFEHKKIKNGDFFIRENRVCNQVGFIINGGTKAFSTNFDGIENVTCFKFENQFITSYTDLISRRSSKKSIQAIEDSTILSISYKDLTHLLSKISSWARIAQLLVEQDYAEKESYLLNYNSKSAKEKYLFVLASSSYLIKRVKTQDLSSYLGITQRTLSRIKKEIITDSSF